MTRKYVMFNITWAMVLAISMMTGCNQRTVAGGGSYPAAAVSGGGDELGVVVDENMKVLQVEPGRAADKAGVQVGDVLDSVEGVSLLKEREKAKRIIHEPKKAKKLHLKFKRDNKDVTLEITAFPGPSGEDRPTVTPVPTSQDYF